eukprot:1398796-Rhodomonas_salina.1
MLFSALSMRCAVILSLFGIFANTASMPCGGGVNSLLAPRTSLAHGNSYSARAGFGLHASKAMSRPDAVCYPGPLLRTSAHAFVLRLRGGGVPKFYGYQPSCAIAVDYQELTMSFLGGSRRGIL